MANILNRRKFIKLMGAASAGAMTPQLFDAACRMVSLMDCPEDAPTLAPLIEREMQQRDRPRRKFNRILSFARIGYVKHIA